MNLGIKGKNALIIASSQGLGKAIAEKLVEEGANVMITSRDEDKLRAVKEELDTIGGGNVYYLKADVTSYEEIKTLITKTADLFGTIDILVNNSGGPKAGTFDDMTDEDWQQAFELNLLSYIRVIREVLPFMKSTGGKIVNLTSMSVKEPIDGLILSNTFRLGVVGLTKTLASELAPYDILINTVAPGTIATDRITYLDQTKADKLGITIDEMEKRNKQQIPLKRYGKPEEFANYVAFLLSDVNSYLTGQIMLIDGGKVKSL